ncbi:MAG: Do family serine endopeptidase [Planctomycetes bacterium]|jgi:serine protease Do|nr:Do family serine endopeptidase [Planctomycetota bacterium]HPY74872.1 Do family serine endopeptidase [Planctomycetota bacterium]HQB00898.1 Do family serine endopeptidase [Planctomycetota bacterium]
MLKKFLVIAVIIISICLTTPQAQQQNLQSYQNFSNMFVDVCKNVTPAVVHITISKEVSSRTQSLEDLFGSDLFRRFFQDRLPYYQPKTPRQEQQDKKELRPSGMGSGFIIHPNGYIISNHHVVKDADEIKVVLSDKREFKAKVIGADEKTDVAVIKIEGENFPFISLGDSNKLSVGEWVIAVGNPFGLNQTVTAGIISAKGRANMGIADYEDFIQTDAAINPGNSGGPLLNLNGEVIGMNTAIFSKTGGSLGIGFAVPSNMVRTIANQLMISGKVTRGWLGVTIQEINQEMAQGFGFPRSQGCVVVEVAKDSPAEKANIQTGDIIARYRGIDIEDSIHLRNLVAETPVDQVVTLTIYRDNQELLINVTIGNAANQNQELQSGNEENTFTDIATFEELGVILQEVTPAISKQLRLRHSKGLLIKEIFADSQLRRYGISENSVIAQINRKNVSTIADVREALKLNENKAFLLIITRTGYQYIIVPLRK